MSDDEPIVHDDAGRPPSVGSYLFPLLFVILACSGFLYWRRRQRGATKGFGLQNLARTGPARVRLSMDDDGPASHSFISNNASTDSLPAHALQDLPLLPQSQSQIQDDHPARQSNPSSPIPGYTPPTRLSGHGGLLSGTGRRSARARGPVEGTDAEDEDSASDDSGGDAGAETVFGIGDEEEAEVASQH
ncbi:hypothetical protein BCR39DRAFT_524837 [Naematelia encephala]|uniref:Uncharacterized protein n=1 Tax=Naematelia encephala TaxID=71784 RepID=A0A1Y2BB90_9TREE|nr:hypothetical protein BCR39DRAFT_524837 [Naematelia encephala]